jgi:hypothetical protein
MRLPHQVRCLFGPSLKLLQLSPEAARLYYDPDAHSMAGDTSAQGYPVILANRHFVIVHDWYDVGLCLPDRDPLTIGTHYDEPRAFEVAGNGLWCASGGCGVVIYNLRDPYEPFTSGVESDQWWEIGREEDDTWPVDRLRLIGEDRLRIDVDPASPHGGVYVVNVAQRAVRRRHLTVAALTPPRQPSILSRCFPESPASWLGSDVSPRRWPTF